MTREEAQALFSDYLEDALSTHERDEMQAFLAREPECAAEMFALDRTLSVLHRLPTREPTLDIWREFLPRVEAFQAEQKLGWMKRLRLRGEEFQAQISSGIILWTHALSECAHARLSRYLQHDHGLHSKAEGGGEETC